MPLKKSQLYSSLWASCDELRGGMFASQYKDYVLVLLFTKYITDKYAGQPYAPISIPKGASYQTDEWLRPAPQFGRAVWQGPLRWPSEGAHGARAEADREWSQALVLVLGRQLEFETPSHRDGVLLDDNCIELARVIDPPGWVETGLLHLVRQIKVELHRVCEQGLQLRAAKPCARHVEPY